MFLGKSYCVGISERSFCSNDVDLSLNPSTSIDPVEMGTEGNIRNTEPEASSLGSMLGFVTQSHLTTCYLLALDFPNFLICKIGYIVNGKAVEFGREVYK